MHFCLINYLLTRLILDKGILSAAINAEFNANSQLLRVSEASHDIASHPSNRIAKINNILACCEKYRIDRRCDSRAG